MQDYNYALFVHIVAIVTMYAAISITMVTHHFARRAQSVEAVRTLMAMGKPAGQAIPLLALVALAAGAYMVEDIWAWDVSWIYISLAFFLAMLLLGPLVTERRFQAIGREAGLAPDGSITPGLRARLDDAVLTTTERAMFVAGLGIVYLMTDKPGSGESALAMGISVALGLLWSAPAWLTARARPAEAAGASSAE
ncbi:MAG TPA: hypothetical protein VIW01_04860 [Dehalococcoidia bacterium]